MEQTDKDNIINIVLICFYLLIFLLESGLLIWTLLLCYKFCGKHYFTWVVRCSILCLTTCMLDEEEVVVVMVR